MKQRGYITRASFGAALVVPLVAAGCVASATPPTAPVTPDALPAVAAADDTIDPVGEMCTLEIANAEARKDAVKEAQRVERRGDLRRAIAAFEEIQAACWVPSMDFNLARLYHDVGDDRRARGLARRCAAADRPELGEFGSYASACKALLPSLEPRPSPPPCTATTCPPVADAAASEEPASGFHLELGVGAAFVYASVPPRVRLDVVRTSGQLESNALLQLPDALGMTHDCPAGACTLTTGSNLESTSGAFAFSLLAAGSLAHGRVHLGGLALAATSLNGSESSPGVLFAAGPAAVFEVVQGPGLLFSIGAAPLVGGMWDIDHFIDVTAAAGWTVEQVDRFQLSSSHEAFYGLSTTGLAGGLTAPIRLGFGGDTGAAAVGAVSPLFLAGPGGFVVAVPVLVSFGVQ